MFFDNLLLLLICNNNTDSDPGRRYWNSVGEKPNFVFLKTGISRKITVLGLAILLRFGGRVLQMIFDVLHLLLKCNVNIDSDPGGRY